jgi:uncharacterized protein (DUF427 family)
MSEYPQAITSTNHVAPAPRRIRGIVAKQVVFDTLRALYVWEWANYPQYYIPRADVRTELLSPDGDAHTTPQGAARNHTLRVDAIERKRAARLLETSPLPGVADTMRFTWEAIDEWYEEDEEIFVHPRSPYTRVDALRSTRRVRVELDGVVLADASSCVMVFETGLPTRYYVDRRCVRFEHLVPSETRTACPYKGRTTGYWSVAVGGTTYADLTWEYTFPTRQLLPIAGLVAFLNEKVDIFLDDVAQPRPVTHMG